MADNTPTVTPTPIAQQRNRLTPEKKKQHPKSEKGVLALERTLVYIFLILLTILCLVPFWILFVNASRTTPEIRSSFSFIPGGAFFTNLNNLFHTDNFPVGRALVNSMLIAFCSAILSTYFSALTAYATEVYQFKLKKFVETFILAIMMIPTQVATMGLVMICMQANLFNQFWIIILPSIAAPTVYFYMKQYLASVLPYEIVEAARVDGAGELRIFHTIILPILKPAIAVQFIFAYVASWNNYFMPSMLLKDASTYTIPILIGQLQSSSPDTFDLGKIYMLMFIAVFPTLLIYLIFSRGIIKNLTNGAVKG